MKAIYALKKYHNMSHSDIGLILNHITSIPNLYHYMALRDPNMVSKASFFDQPFFDIIKIQEQEELGYLETPPMVEEGALTCKCGSSKVYSFSKQTRRGDESTTVFAMCFECKQRWCLG